MHTHTHQALDFTFNTLERLLGLLPHLWPFVPPLCFGHSDALLCIAALDVSVYLTRATSQSIDFLRIQILRNAFCLRHSLLISMIKLHLPPPSSPLLSVSVSVFFNSLNICMSAHIDVTGAKKLLTKDTVCRLSSKNVLCLLLSPCAMMKHDEKQLMMRHTKPQIIYYTHTRSELCLTF